MLNTNAHLHIYFSLHFYSEIGIKNSFLVPKTPEAASEPPLRTIVLTIHSDVLVKPRFQLDNRGKALR